MYQSGASFLCALIKLITKGKTTTCSMRLLILSGVYSCRHPSCINYILHTEESLVMEGRRVPGDVNRFSADSGLVSAGKG